MSSRYLSIEDAYRDWGINNYENCETSGERRFLGQILPQFKNPPIVVDVGANIGDYSALVLSIRSDANIVAIEPNPDSYLRLKSRLFGNNVTLIECACAGDEGDLKFYSPSNDPTSPRSSTDADWSTMYGSDGAVVERTVKARTLGEVLRSLSVTHVDLLKIDVEGGELDVLRGCKDYLEDGSIKVIQFEFGEAHALRRVFLRDFRDLLLGYRLTRVARDRLIDLGEYRPKNWEIFCYQNIVAFSLRSTKRS